MQEANTRSGFSIIEILITVSIITVLIGFILNKFDPIARKGEAYDNERTVHERQVYKAINDYLWSGQFPPSDFPDVGEEKWICSVDLTGTACTDLPTAGGINGVDLSFLVTQDYMQTVPTDSVYANAESTGLLLKKQGEFYIVESPFKGIYKSPPDPVAHWKLDETTLGTAYEEMGGYDGTHHGGAIGLPAYTHFPNDKSLNFDGVSDYVDVTGVTTGASHTISAWIKTSDNGRIFDCSAGIAIFGISGGFIRYNDGVWHTSTTNTVTDGNWNHVAAVSDATSINLYVNGVSIYTDSITANSIDGSAAIGSNNSGTATFFNGLMDDVKIYDQALTAQQIQWIAQGLF